MHYTQVLPVSIFLNIVAVTLVLVALYHSGINTDLITGVVVINLLVAVYLGITLYQSKTGCRSLSYEVAVVMVTVLLNAIFLDYAINGVPTYFGNLQKDTLQVITVAGALVCSVLYIFTSCRKKKKVEVPETRGRSRSRTSRRPTTYKSVVFVDDDAARMRKASSVFEQILPTAPIALSVRASTAPDSVKTSIQSDISQQCDDYVNFLHNDSVYCRECAVSKLGR